MAGDYGLGAHEARRRFSYLAIVVLLMLVLPLASLLIETREPGMALVGKWWTPPHEPRYYNFDATTGERVARTGRRVALPRLADSDAK